MAVKHTWTLTVKSDLGGSGTADSYQVPGDAEENVSPNGGVAAGAVAIENVAAINGAALVSFSIESDKDITVKFNSTGAPTSPSPLSLKAGKSYAWNNTMLGANPLAAVTITKLIFDNTDGTATANPKAVFLMNVGS